MVPDQRQLPARLAQRTDDAGAGADSLIRRFGLDRRLARTLMEANFWWYWIPARISYGAATFSFFYLLHRRGAQIGYSLLGCGEA
jgi:hypothetical protein